MEQVGKIPGLGVVLVSSRGEGGFSGKGGFWYWFDQGQTEDGVGLVWAWSRLNGFRGVCWTRSKGWAGLD